MITVGPSDHKQAHCWMQVECDSIVSKRHADEWIKLRSVTTEQVQSN